MKSTTPAPQHQEPVLKNQWLTRHDAFLDRKAQGAIDLLFIGDSITEAWATDGKEIWDREYAPLNAANFGIGGDETQHVLWRLGNGEVDGISPRLIVLKIGTNNFGNGGHGVDETVAGIVKVVQTLKEKLPRSRILLLGLFPRDAEPGTLFRTSIIAVNKAIAGLADGKQVTFLDISKKFLQDNGRISPAIMPDYLHLSAEAYQIWADAMRPTLAALFEKPRMEDIS